MTDLIASAVSVRQLLCSVAIGDFCTPLHMSEEIAREIPDAEFAVMPDGGHMIHSDQEQLYFEKVYDAFGSTMTNS